MEVYGHGARCVIPTDRRKLDDVWWTLDDACLDEASLDDASLDEMWLGEASLDGAMFG